jgi:FAD/FMN-containing dehydrogenase
MDSNTAEEVIKALRLAIGPEKVLTDDYLRESYTQDLTLYAYSYSTPLLIALPESTAEVQEIVRLANRYKIPVLPLGGATSSWGALDSNGGIVIDMINMNKIIEVDEKNLTFTVQGGASIRDVNVKLRNRGFCYPTYPLCFGPITFASDVSKNSGGECGSMYGHVAKRLIALEVVLGNGEILVTGSSKVLKNAPLFQQSGLPDLTQLFVSAEGAYGVITQVTMQMQMSPVAHRGLDFKFEATPEGFKNACGFASELRKRKGIVANGHLIDFYNIWLVERARTGKGIDELEEESARKRIGHKVLVEIDSFVSENECETKKEAVLEIAKQYGGIYDGNQMAAMFHAGEMGDASLTKAVYAGGFVGVFWSVDLPYDRLPLFYERWLGLLDQLGLPRAYSSSIIALGDDGCIPFAGPWYKKREHCDPLEWTEVMDKWKKLAQMTFEVSLEIGAIPYRVGRAWRPHMFNNLDPTYLQYIRSVKKMFDPNNIMNPGVSVFEGVRK